MADERIGLELDVEVGTFKQQLREATKDLNTMVEKFGATSAEAVKAAKKVAGLRDEIGDMKTLFEAFNPDRKFQALQGAINGVLGGFTAFQGAMGLIGIEGENVEKTLLKVQSAMALTQGINNILELKDTFSVLTTVVKNNSLVLKANALASKAASGAMKLLGISAETTSVSFKVLKTAIIATGIGLLVVAIGELIANFDAIKKKITDLFPGLAKLGEFFGDLVQKVTDFVGITSEATREVDRLAKHVEEANKANERRVKVLEAQGGKEKEVFELTRENIFRELGFLKQKEALGEELDKKELDRRTELLNDLEVLEAKRGKFIADANKKAQDEIDKANEQRAAKEKARREAEAAEQKKRIEEAKKLASELTIDNSDFDKSDKDKELSAAERELDNQIKILEAGGQSIQPALEAFRNSLILINQKYDQMELDMLADKLAREDELRKTAAEAEVERIAAQQEVLTTAIAAFAANEQIAAEQRREYLNGVEQAILADRTLTEEQKNTQLAALSDARNTIDQLEVEQKQKTVTAIGNLAAQAAQIAGEQTAAGKALAVVAATIQTFQSAQAAFAGMVSSIPGPVGIGLGIAAAALAVATGVKNVQKILSVKIPGKGGGGSAPSISASSAAPLTPGGQLVTNTVELGANTINNQNNRAVKAYVIEKDITDSQRRQERISRAATLGG